MKTLIRSRTFFAGAGLAALLALGPSQMHGNLIGNANAQPAGDPLVPLFEADPYWPKPLPNGWILGMVIGLGADPRDNIWITHRPESPEFMESYQTRGEGDCCTAAPDILAFDPAGNVIHTISKASYLALNGPHDWPTSNHGITVGPDGNLWTGGNGAGQPGPAPGSLDQFKPNSRDKKTEFAEGGGEKGRYHDSFILKLSPEGKFLGEIGTANGSKGSLDTLNTKGVAMIRFLPDGTLVAADGYGNHRVSEWDPATFKNKRIWGAYGKPPTDDTLPTFDTNSTQFSTVHCAEPSKDGLLYVCDRNNNRIQVFKFDGTYLNQYTLEPGTKGSGSIWEIAFSRDPAQKYMYISDGTSEKIHVWDRATMKELYWFGGGGRQPGRFYAPHSVITDSKGNIFTSETYNGQRVQKFTLKGMRPLSVVLKMGHSGNSTIGPAKMQ